MSESGSQDEFDQHYKELEKKACPQFMQYMDENWKNCTEAWIMFVRNMSWSLGIRSNNHLEEHNSKIKTQKKIKKIPYAGRMHEEPLLTGS